MSNHPEMLIDELQQQLKVMQGAFCDKAEEVDELVELVSGLALCLFGQSNGNTRQQVKDDAARLLKIYGGTTDEQDRAVYPLAQVAYRAVSEVRP